MRRDERLDETIDRVAKAMTHVGSDEGFSRRLAMRVDSRTSRWLTVGAPVGVAASVLLVVALNITRTDRLAHVTVTGADVALPNSPTAAPVASSPAIAAAPVRRASASRRLVLAPFEPVIAALPQPEMLGVNHLTFESLAVAPVEVAPIDLVDLEVRALETPIEPQEK